MRTFKDWLIDILLVLVCVLALVVLVYLTGGEGAKQELTVKDKPEYKWILVKRQVTMYALGDGHCGTHGNMASGEKVFVGAVAMPKRYKFGTQIYIPRFDKWRKGKDRKWHSWRKTKGKFVVKDRGSWVERYNRVDIYSPSIREARRWGCKKIKVWIRIKRK